MRRLPFPLLAVVAVGCGSRALTPDAGDAATEAEVAAAPVCLDATPRDATTHETPAGRIFCGGELAVAGPTPFGWWEPKTVSSVFQLGDCFGLAILFGDDVSDAGEPSGPSLRVGLGQAKPDRAWSGTFDVTGYFVWGTTPHISMIPVTVEITSATALYDADAGSVPFAGMGPVGLVTGRIDADTGCGHVTGTFSVPYCSWSACINL